MTRTSLNGLVPGKLIGFTKHGLPVYGQAGGAPTDLSDWTPIEYSPDVIKRVQTESAIERYAQGVPMGSSTKEIPRSGGLEVTADTTYSDDDSVNDKVILKARRHIARVLFEEDELDDANSLVNVIATKNLEWATSYAAEFDNSCLGVSAAESNTPSDKRPYTSVYKALRTSDSNVGYTADANYLSWDDDKYGIADPPDGTSIYEKISTLMELVESGDYFSPEDMVFIAHPSWKSVLRKTFDGAGHPIFENTQQLDDVTGRPVDLLIGRPVVWSRGARVSAVATQKPLGNPLMFFVNTRYLARGDRSGPETLSAPARPQDDTDVTAVKYRVRKAFLLTHPGAAAVLERITD